MSWIVVAIAGSLTGRALGILLPLGYTLSQLPVTLGTTFKSEFGILGWLFIVGYGVAAILVTLLLVAGMALARSLYRWAAMPRRTP